MRCFVAALLLCLGTTLADGQKFNTPWGLPASVPGKRPGAFGSPDMPFRKSATPSAPKVDSDFSGSILGTNSVFKWIPAGQFEMGSTGRTDPDRGDNETQHTVILSRGFWLLDHEVTQGEYEAVMGGNPSNFRGADRPVEMVSWYDAVAFCQALTRKDRDLRNISERHEYRLPTESEWEYACRAGTTTALYYNDGDRNRELDVIAWWDWNSGKETHPVKQKLPNAFGLYDMLGNVRERCSDWYGDYPSGDVTDPKGPSSGSFRVIRGGSWYSVAEYARSADRSRDVPGLRLYNLGFRPALSPVRSAQ